MKKSLTARILAVVLTLTLANLACGLSNSGDAGAGEPSIPVVEEPGDIAAEPEKDMDMKEGEVTEAPAEEISEPIDALETGYCAHPYYPVAEGASWTWVISSDIANDQTQTASITSVSADGFTSFYSLDDPGVTQDIAWYCTPEGLLASQLSNLTGVENGTVSDWTASGISLPAAENFVTGASWETQYSFTVTVDQDGTAFNASAVLVQTNTLTGYETVNTPAGNFENAARVEGAATLTITMFDTPTTLSYTTVNYFAEGVGLVKSDASGTTGGSTVVLTGYSLP